MSGVEMLVIVVRFTVQAEHAERFFERVRAQARATTAAEADCRQFDVCRDASDPRRFFLYEVYPGEPAFGAHLQSSHFKAFDAETREWVEEKVVERWMRSADDE